MPLAKPTQGSLGSDLVKFVAGLCLIALVVRVGIEFFEIGLQIWALAKAGFYFCVKAFLVVLALILASILIALLCDALAPVLRRIKKVRERRIAIQRCRLPSLQAFLTGKSPMDGEVEKIDAFLASLLRDRYCEMTGRLPDGSTFRNRNAFSSFKAGELVPVLMGAKHQVEQELFAPLIGAYRMSDASQTEKEAGR
jgi:hypothetical protein